MAVITRDPTSIQTIIDERSLRRAQGESCGDFAMLDYVRARPSFLPTREPQVAGLPEEDVTIVDQKFKLFDTHHVYVSDEYIAARKILEELPKTKTTYAPKTLGHAIRMLMVYILYWRIKTSQGFTPTPMSDARVTSPVTQVTKPGFLKTILARFTTDWPTSVTDWLKQVRTVRLNSNINQPFSGDDLWMHALSVEGNVLLGDNIVRNIASFAAYLSYQLAEDTTPMREQMWPLVKERVDTIADKEKRKEWENILRGTSETKIDAPALWALTVSPVVLLCPLQLSSHDMPYLQALEVLLIQSKRQAPQPLSRLECAILQHAALVARQQETIDDMITEVYNIWEGILKDAGEMSPEDRSFLYDTLKPPELQEVGEPSKEPSGKRKRAATNQEGLYKGTDASPQKIKPQRSKRAKTRTSKSASPTPSSQSRPDAGPEHYDDGVDSDVEIIDTAPLKMDEVGDIFWSMSTMAPSAARSSVPSSKYVAPPRLNDSETFDLWPGPLGYGAPGPISYTWTPVEGPTSEDELQVFREMLAAIQELYVLDSTTRRRVPMHTLPSAQDLALPPSGDVSSIKIIPLSIWNTLTTAKQQQLVRDFHVLIQRGTEEEPPPEFSWSLETLQRLNSGKPNAETHDISRRNLDNMTEENILNVPLRRLWAAGLQPVGQGEALSVLDVPDKLKLAPQLPLDAIDDGRKAFDFPPSVKNLPDKEYPHGHAWWWLLGTGGYVSRIHIDAEGAGTAIMFPTGGKSMAGKLWFLARPKEEQHDTENNTAIPLEYDPEGSNRSLYFWEAVFLREGDLMVMRCGTPHYVFTTDATIAYGKHFYTMACLSRSVSCLVHAVFTEQYTTNIGHIPFFRVILRLLPYWHSQLSDPTIAQRDANVLVLNNVDHLEALMAVGALAIFYPVLCQRDIYTKSRDIGSVELGGYRCHFLWIMCILAERYSLTASGREHDVTLFLEEQLGGFAHAVAAYAVRVKHETPDFARPMSPDLVVKALNDCLDEFWPMRRWKNRDITAPADWQISRRFIDLRPIKVHSRQATGVHGRIELDQFVKARLAEGS